MPSGGIRVTSTTSRLDDRTIAASILAAGVLVGLLVPPLTRVFQPYALPALFLVMVFSLIPFARLERDDLFSVEPTVWRMVLWQQLLLPCLIIAAGILAKFPDTVISLMIVTACAGSLFAAPALAELLGLDRRRALQCMVLSTLIMPASLYAFLSTFLGVNVEMNFQEYSKRALLFLIIPFGIFAIYRLIVRHLPEIAAEHVNGVGRWGSIISLLIFGIGVMASVSEQVYANPLKVVFYLVVASSVATAMLAITTVVTYRHGLTEALTAGILSGFRNVGLGYALVGDMIGPELAPYVGVSMLPIFIAPLAIRWALVANPEMRLAQV
jgi:BASS family bile acid:Na+ symporter